MNYNMIEQLICMNVLAKNTTYIGQMMAFATENFNRGLVKKATGKAYFVTINKIITNNDDIITF